MNSSARKINSLRNRPPRHCWLCVASLVALKTRVPRLARYQLYFFLQTTRSKPNCVGKFDTQACPYYRALANQLCSRRALERLAHELFVLFFVLLFFCEISMLYLIISVRLMKPNDSSKAFLRRPMKASRNPANPARRQIVSENFTLEVYPCPRAWANQLFFNVNNLLA